MEHFKNVKVYTSDLIPGLTVTKLDRAWTETSFIMQGFTIESPFDVISLRRQCEYVYVDFKSLDEYRAFKIQTTRSDTYRRKLASKSSSVAETKKRLNSAVLTHRKSNRLVKTLFDRIALGQEFDIASVRSNVKDNVKQILANPEAMLMMSMLKSQSEDLAQHSLNVSILSIGFAHHLGFSKVELEDIGMAAMLHDIGLVKVDRRLIHKPSKLNKDETEQVQKHCQYGFDILSGRRGLTPSCIDVAMAHHEQVDGNGYPRGLVSDKITKVVKIISIIDVYDTITNYQVYAKIMSIKDAYREMMKGKATRFDLELLLKFIKWRSIYPPGTIVELANGEVGIVIGSKETNRLKPRIMLVLDEYKEPCKETIIDLSKLQPEMHNSGLRIIQAFENSAFGIDIQEYAEKGLVINP